MRHADIKISPKLHTVNHSHTQSRSCTAKYAKSEWLSVGHYSRTHRWSRVNKRSVTAPLLKSSGRPGPSESGGSRERGGRGGGGTRATTHSLLPNLELIRALCSAPPRKRARNEKTVTPDEGNACLPRSPCSPRLTKGTEYTLKAE